MRELVKVDAASDEVMRSLQQQMYFVSGDIDNAGLYARLRGAWTRWARKDAVLYLAIPPTAYGGGGGGGVVGWIGRVVGDVVGGW